VGLLLSGRVVDGDAGSKGLRCRVGDCGERRSLLVVLGSQPVSALCVGHARELDARLYKMPKVGKI
jgi:hypothetical protein